MKNSVIFYLVIILLSFRSNGQKIDRLEFSKGKKMPEPLYGMAYSSDGQKAIIAGGRSFRNFETKYIFVYEGKTKSWLNLTTASKLDPMVYGCATYLGDGYESVLIAGGINNNMNYVGLVEDLKSLDLNNYRTTILGANPIPAKGQSIAYWKDKVYIFGGALSMDKTKMSSTTYYNQQVFEYDLTNGTINQLKNLPTSKETSGTIVNGELFVFGGYNGKPNNQIHKYNIGDDHWATLDSLKQAVSSYAIVKFNQYILLIGDYENMDQLIRFDTKTHETKYFKMNLLGRHMGAAILNNELHIFGGYDPEQKRHLASDQHWFISLEKIIL